MRSLVTTFVLVMAMAGSSFAHSWQEGSAPLQPAEVEAVLEEISVITDTAREEGWTDNEAQADPLVRFYDIIWQSDGRFRTSPAADRVLTAFEAFRQGEVDAGGAFTEGSDFLRWIDFLHPADVISIQPYLDRLNAWRDAIPGGAP